MKKYYFLLAAFFAGYVAKAQLNETFGNVGTLNTVTVGTGSWNVGGLPTGWTQYNGDGLTPYTTFTGAFGTNAWITREVTYTSGVKDTIAVSTSYYTPAGASNDWLISPTFTPTAGQYLLFEALAQDANYPDGFLVKVSTTGAAYTNFTAAPILTVPSESAAGWVTHAVDLSAYAGQAINLAFVNNSNDMFLLYLNNIRVTTLPANDLALTSMTPSTATYKSYATVGGAIAVQGFVINLGSSTVTSYTVKLNDGTNTQSFPQTASLTPYASGSFSISYTMPSVGIKPMKMWVEFPGDLNHSNDTTTADFGGATFTPTHRNVFEEATGTWCGWCPRGAVFMDSVHGVYPDDIYIAVHNSDVMTVTAYDAGITALPGFGGFPTVCVGRSDLVDPQDLFTAYSNHKSDFGVADITVSQPTVSGTTITVKADVKMAINTKASYDYRLALVVSKDDEHGTTTTWDQHNYYSGAAAPNLVGAGINWDNEADPVPAAKMYYDFVAKDIVGGFTGVAGSLPGAMTAGSTYSYTFNWTVPAGLELQKTKCNVLLISGLSKEAQNGSFKGAYPTSVQTIVADNELNIYPNPSNNYLNVDFNLQEQADVTFTLTDITGHVVYHKAMAQLNGSQGLVINTTDLTEGIYSLRMQVGDKTLVRKVTIAH